MKKTLHVLIIEDSQEDTELNVRLLENAGYHVIFRRVETSKEMIVVIQELPWDIILSDYSMPHFTVLEAIEICRSYSVDIPLIVISGAIGEEKAVELIRAGAHDYLLKDNMSRFILTVERALRDAHDKKDRVKLHDALACSEKKYRSYIDYAPDGVFVADENGRYIEVNEAATRITGFSTRQLLAMSISDILHPDSLMDGLSHFKNLRETGKARDDLAFIHKNGKKRWWSVEAVRLNETRYLGFTKDITDRIVMEESLKLYREELVVQNVELMQAQLAEHEIARKFAELYEFAPVGYFSVTADSVIRELNFSGAIILGKDRKNLLGRHFNKFVSASTRAAFDVFLQDIFSGMAREICELVLETRGNPPIHVHAEGLLQQNGTQCLFNLVDITQRKLAEDALTHTATRLELATHAGGSCVWDFDMVHSNMIWDDQMFSLYGVDKMTFVPTYNSWRAAILPVDRLRCDAEIAMALSSEKKFDTEFRIRWPNGSIRNIRAIAVVVRDESGKPVRSTGINWDVTGKRKLEEKLKFSEENFRTFFESIDDMIIVGNMHGKIIHVNDSVSRKLGYTSEELLSMQVVQVHPEEFQPEAEDIINRMLTGETGYCPLPLARKDGTLVPVETRVWLGKWNGKDCIFGYSKDLSAEQEAFQKFNRIFDGNPALMAISSFPDNLFTEVNKSFIEKTGYTRAELLGRGADDINLFVEPEKHKAAAVEFMETGRVQNCELRIRIKSGAFLDGLFSGEIIESQGKKYFLTVMVDVTDRKEAESEIKKVNRLLNSVIENIPNMVFLKDCETLRFVQFNKAGEELIGSSRDEMLGKNDYDLFTREQADFFTTCDREVLVSGLMSDIIEEQILTKKKGMRILHTQKVPILNAEGEAEYLLGISEDITERKQAAEALRLSEEGFRSIFENNSASIAIIEADSTISMVNNEYCKVSGFSRQEVEGMKWTEMIPPEERERMMGYNQNRKSGRGDAPEKYEFMFRQKNGSVKHAIMSVSVLAGQRMIASFIDITDRKLVEDELRLHGEILENMSEGVFLIRATDEIIVYVNPKFNSMMGYEPGELVGKHVSIVNAPSETSPAEVANDIIRQLHSTGIWQGEIQNIRKDSMICWCSVNISSFEHPLFGHVWISIHQDISIRKRIIRELQKNEERFRHISSTISDISYSCVSSPGVGYSIDWMTGAAESITGYTIDEIKELGCWGKLVVDEDLERFRKNILSLRPGSSGTCELRLHHKGGWTVWIASFAECFETADQNGLVNLYGGLVDITERKYTEETLMKSEEQYRLLINTTHESVIVVQDGLIKFINPISLIILEGMVEHEIIDRPFVDFIHPDDRGIVSENYRKRIESRETISPYSFRVVTGSGMVKWLEINAAVFEWQGHPATLNFLNDITERVKSETALRENEEFFRSVVNNSSELTSITDANGVITFISPQCENVLGYPIEIILRLGMPDIIHPEDIEKCLAAWSEVFDQDLELHDFEYRTIDRNGIVRWVSHSAKLVKINNSVLGMQNTIRNITERKIAEQAIKVSEEKYKTLLNASPDGIFLIQPDKIIAEVSEIGVELFGVEGRKDLVGKNFLRFVPGDEKGTISEIIGKTLNEGLAQNVELKIRKRNNTIFLSEISSTLIQGPSGAPILFMIIVRNISQRKKIETSQIHADRMASLGEMAAGIAHEINQPLNIISMVMDKILFQSSRDEIFDVEFLKKKSDKIFDNITRIKNIIDHIRAFSRSHDDYVLTAFYLNSSIRNAVSMISEQFKHLGIDLRLQLDEEIPSIVGNTYKFEQVILNLLVNAKDAVIERKTRQEEYSEMIIGITSFQENHFIVIEVADNGIGISNDDINHIILPFYTTKDEGKGTGLGLSICYQIIKEMNGNIEITSDRGKGTKIKLVLRIHNKEVNGKS